MTEYKILYRPKGWPPSPKNWWKVYMFGTDMEVTLAKFKIETPEAAAICIQERYYGRD